MEGLQSVLEGTETAEVMVATVDILRHIHSVSPNVLEGFFQVGYSFIEFIIKNRLYF